MFLPNWSQLKLQTEASFWWHSIPRATAKKKIHKTRAHSAMIVSVVTLRHKASDAEFLEDPSTEPVVMTSSQKTLNKG